MKKSQQKNTASQRRFRSHKKVERESTNIVSPHHLYSREDEEDPLQSSVCGLFPPPPPLQTAKVELEEEEEEEGWEKKHDTFFYIPRGIPLSATACRHGSD